MIQKNTIPNTQPSSPTSQSLLMSSVPYLASDTLYSAASETYLEDQRKEFWVSGVTQYIGYHLWIKSEYCRKNM